MTDRELFASPVTITSVDRRQRLSTQVFRVLRDEIVRGVLAPGAKISEQNLCERLNISRTPLREALWKLAEEGLVRIYPQHGSFVSEIDFAPIRQAQFMREHLECALVVKAVQLVTDDGVRALCENVHRQEYAGKQRDFALFHTLDEELHAKIADIAGYPGVWDVLAASKVHFDRVRYMSLRIADQIDLLVGQHAEIVAAIAKRDAPSAEAALRRHLREVFRTMEQLQIDKNGS